MRAKEVEVVVVVLTADCRGVRRDVSITFRRKLVDRDVRGVESRPTPWARRRLMTRSMLLLSAHQVSMLLANDLTM